ncbi:MAG: 50S ribosomal protein L21 [Candidatus Pacebacteria bacterium]|nr:50S ribosomal protein L21 [Candidatus Paceibacterota bacterium]
MTFSVIQTGGKQYKVKEGDIVTIEKLEGDYKEGDKIVFNEVVLSSDDKDVEVGAPFLKDKKVEAKFIEEGKAKKVTSLRFKNKTNQGMGTKKGHRQSYFKVEITKI